MSLTRLRFVALASFAIFIGACGGSAGGETPTPATDSAIETATSPPVTPTSSVPSETPTGATYRALTIVPALTLSIGREQLVVTGCWACEGNDRGLVRVIRTALGETLVETLLSEGDYAGETLQRISADSRARLIAAVLCTGGNCSPTGTPAIDAHVRIILSRDGGVSWQAGADFEGYVSIQGVTGAEVLVSRFHLVGDVWTKDYLLLLSGVAVSPPPGSGEFPRALLMPSGSVAWLSADQRTLLDGDGNKMFDPQLPPGGIITNVLFGEVYAPGSADAGPRLVEWKIEGRPARCFVGAYLPNGEPAIHQGGETVYELLRCGIVEFFGAADIDLKGAFGSVITFDERGRAVGRVPAGLILTDGRVVALEMAPFTDIPGRNRLVAQRPGNVRVVTETGCVNVRDRPSLEGTVLVCYGNGVVMQATGPTEDADGITWVAVNIVDGRFGWMPHEFVESLP